MALGTCRKIPPPAQNLTRHHWVAEIGDCGVAGGSGRDMTAAERIAAALGRARRSGRWWSCCCPAHDDRSPSLSIRDGRGGGLIAVCHAGCWRADILGELSRRGLYAGEGPMAPVAADPEAERLRREADEADQAGRIAEALDIWTDSYPADATTPGASLSALARMGRADSGNDPRARNAWLVWAAPDRRALAANDRAHRACRAQAGGREPDVCCRDDGAVRPDDFHNDRQTQPDSVATKAFNLLKQHRSFARDQI
jgi:hypothetical protein